MKRDIVPLSQFMGELRSMLAEFAAQTAHNKGLVREDQRLASQGRFIKLQMLLKSCSDEDYQSVVLPYLLSHPELDRVWECRSSAQDTRYRDLVNVIPLDQRVLEKWPHITHPKQVFMYHPKELRDGFTTEFAKENGFFSQVTSYEEMRNMPNDKGGEFYFAYAHSNAVKRLERIDIHLFRLELRGSERAGMDRFIWEAQNVKELIIRHNSRNLLLSILLRGTHQRKLEVLRLHGLPLLGMAPLRPTLKFYGASLVELDLVMASSPKEEYLRVIDDLPNLKHLSLPYADFHRNGEAILKYAESHNRVLTITAQEQRRT